MKVLVLGAGGAASNGFARALKMAGGYELVGTNSNADDILLSECDENHLIPPATDFDGWRQGLHEVVKRAKPTFVHAQNDDEVEALARFRTTIHMQGARTWLPTTEQVRLCRDKWRSYEVWREARVNAPRTLIANKPSVFESFGRCWLRPRKGAGGQKAFLARSAGEARMWLDRHDGWGKFTIAEVLTPRTVTVQALYWKGELVAAQQRTRESWANAGSTTAGVSGSTGVGFTSSDPAVDTVATQAVYAIGVPHGLYGVDMAFNERGKPCVTEINIGRFFTTAPEFFAMAGFNMADLYVREGENAYYMRDQGFTDTKPKFAGRNPIPDGYRWIRGMDRPPVLVSA